MNQPVTGLVLAGGQSRRMGTDKGLVVYRGIRLIERALSILTPLCNELLISTSNRYYGLYGYRLVGDSITGVGPGAGILAGLQEAANPAVVVISVDTPNITSDFLRQLLSITGSGDAVIPRHPNGFIEPLCAVYQKQAASVVEQALHAGTYKLTDILSLLKVTYCDIPPAVNAKFLFHNINTKDDLNQ